MVGRPSQQNPSIRQLTLPPETIPSCYLENAPHRIPTTFRTAPLAMHLIREVRNEFAHRIEQITFDHPDVATKIETRILRSIKKLGKSNREMFIDSFSAVALIIYSTLSATDIRIKSLEATHQEHFVQMVLKYSEVLREANPAAGEP